MNKTLEHVLKKFNVGADSPSPITIHYDRYKIHELFNELGYKTGAEVGTELGFYSLRLCERIPGLKLYCVDLYSAKYHQGNSSQEKLDHMYKRVLGRLHPFDAHIMRMASIEAVKNIPDKSLDFVFIDANHDFEFVVNDIIYWSKKVKIGGIVYGHDYSDEFAVKDAVHAFTHANNIKSWFILNAGRRNIYDSWMYVRDENDSVNKYE